LKFLENILFKSVPVWFFVLVLIIIISLGLFSTVLAYKISVTEVKLPKIHKVMTSTLDNLSLFWVTAKKVISTGQVNNQVVKVDNAVGFSSLLNNDEVVKVDNAVGFSSPNNDDLEGYFLVSAYDAGNGVSSIFLFDLNSKKLIKEWAPDTSELEILLNKLSVKSNENKIQNFRSQHPIMTEDGGVIISSGDGVLLKLDEDSKIEWFIDRQIHHSIEPGLTENQYISQIVVDNDVKFLNGKVIKPLRNDGYVIFSGDGKIVEERSFAQILVDNGYASLLVSTTPWHRDRVHLNDAEYIFETDKYVKKGDIMMSSRHLSTVLLYRPSENKVIWLKQGPFLNQHDVNYLGNGVFSILGNDNVNGPLSPRLYADHSSIYTYDMKTDEVQIMLTLDKVPSLDSGGRAKLLENGDIFFNNFSKAFILDADGNIKLSYAHPVGETSVGTMHWTRHYSEIKVEK